MSIFDEGKKDNCAVVFPWNLKDQETNRDRDKLRRRLAGVFPIQFHKVEPSLLFDGITDVDTFKAELSKLLTKYMADINRSLEAARKLPETSVFKTPASTRPDIHMNIALRPASQITMFYSYKGGTGPSMLLANVAWILASAGKRVLAIDWDLEAPGLHHYFHPFLIDPRLEATDGLIDMVVEYSRDAVTPEEQGSGSKWLEHAADVGRFVAGINWTFPNNGQLHLCLPVGRTPHVPCG
jgi:hypothetical protein